jgi:hypothetical protein
MKNTNIIIPESAKQALVYGFDDGAMFFRKGVDEV